MTDNIHNGLNHHGKMMGKNRRRPNNEGLDFHGKRTPRKFDRQQGITIVSDRGRAENRAFINKLRGHQ